MGGRLLMIAFHYPPGGAVAAQRAHKFARYLPEFGWEPFVVARRPDPRQPVDESFAGRAAARVRLNPLEPSRLLGLLPEELSGALRRFLFIPDEEAGWMASVVAALPAWIERFRPDVLWANSVPTGSLVAAACVAGRMRLPLVLDFHNEWTGNMYYRPSTPLHDAVHHGLESCVIRRARAVTTLNPLHTEDLRARFPGVRCETIENGYDPEDYEVDPPGPAPPFVFTYAGAVYGYQSPAPFLRTLGETGRTDVAVRIVGDRFGRFRTGSWPFPVSLQGHVAHRDLGRVFSASRAFFLCLEPPAARQLPAKLYEYARAGRPIFAIAPRAGAVDRWLRDTGAGVCVPSEEPGRWASALDEFVGAIGSFRPAPLGGYHRRALAGVLAGILDAIKGRS